jgi:hypothetical protein
VPGLCRPFGFAHRYLFHSFLYLFLNPFRGTAPKCSPTRRSLSLHHVSAPPAPAECPPGTQSTSFQEAAVIRVSVRVPLPTASRNNNTHQFDADPLDFPVELLVAKRDVAHKRVRAAKSRQHEVTTQWLSPQTGAIVTRTLSLL